MIPSGDVAAIFDGPAATATKTPVVVLQVTERQAALTGKVRCVHVVPLVDEAAMSEFTAIATKIPALGLQVTAIQVALTGKLRRVHVIPSGDEAAMAVLMATATKRLVEEVTAYHSAAGIVLCVHVVPFVDEAATLGVWLPIVTKTPVEGFTATPSQSAVVGKVRCVHVIPSVDEAAMAEV